MGVLTEEFELPLYPKVGFWTIRVVAEGQASTDFMTLVSTRSFKIREQRVNSIYISQDL